MVHAMLCRPWLLWQRVESLSLLDLKRLTFYFLTAFPTSFTAEQLSSLERRLREESKTMGAIYRMRVVWGRKPGRGVAH